MCTQKAFRSNPLSMASCDLSFTFPQQRKKKPKQLQRCGKILPSPRDTVKNFIIQENWNCFKHFPILTITDCSRGLQNFPGMKLGGTSSYMAAGQMCFSMGKAAAHPASAGCPAGGLESLSSDGIFKLPFTMCYQGYHPFARNRASKGLFMPIWFLLSYIRGQGRDRARFLSSKSILYGTQFSKVQPASAFMKHCAVKNEGSCFSPFKDVW